MDGKIEKYINHIVKDLIKDTKIVVAINPNYTTVFMPTEKYNYNHYNNPEDYDGTIFRCNKLREDIDVWFSAFEGKCEDYEHDYLSSRYGVTKGPEADEVMIRYADSLFNKLSKVCSDNN